jgi:hypothetical protein
LVLSENKKEENFSGVRPRNKHNLTPVIFWERSLAISFQSGIIETLG